MAPSHSSELVRAHVFISGRVQGVFFRSGTRDEARRAKVFGYVRNLPDGRVEALFEGEKSSVGKMVLWCKDGPPGSQVDHVDTSWEQYTGDYDRFEIR